MRTFTKLVCWIRVNHEISGINWFIYIKWGPLCKLNGRTQEVKIFQDITLIYIILLILKRKHMIQYIMMCQEMLIKAIIIICNGEFWSFLWTASKTLLIFTKSVCVWHIFGSILQNTACLDENIFVASALIRQKKKGNAVSISYIFLNTEYIWY